MRILHILEATQGGTRRHVLDLLPALVRLGFECDLVYSPERYPPFRRDAAWLRERGVNCFEIPMVRGVGGRRDATALLVLRTHLRTHAYDAVHCHSTKAGFLGRLAAPWKMPVVYTPHCIAFDTSLPRGSRRIARLVETLLAPRTAHFIAVSCHEARVMRSARLCPASRLSVIYNGVDLEDFDTMQKSLESRLFEHLKSNLTIGCFGRLTRQKNQAALLRAWPQVQGAVPAAHLLLVGSGEDEVMLRTLAEKMGVTNGVTFAGEIEEARPLYAVCDIVAQPSRWEGCPYSILEAMAACRPVVASRVGGVPEVLEASSGMVYRAGQTATLAEHLISLARDESRRHLLGGAARLRIEKHFSAARMVQRTAEIYNCL